MPLPPPQGTSGPDAALVDVERGAPRRGLASDGHSQRSQHRVHGAAWLWFAGTTRCCEPRRADRRRGRPRRRASRALLSQGESFGNDRLLPWRRVRVRRRRAGTPTRGCERHCLELRHVQHRVPPGTQAPVPGSARRRHRRLHVRIGPRRSPSDHRSVRRFGRGLLGAEFAPEAPRSGIAPTSWRRPAVALRRLHVQRRNDPLKRRPGHAPGPRPRSRVGTGVHRRR